MRFLMLVRATPDVAPADAGALLAADRLLPRSKGVRVRYAGGAVEVSDPPDDPATPSISGYWLVEAESKDAAVEWAKRVALREGEVEIRPLFELDDFPVDPAETPDGWRRKEEEFRAAPAPARRPGTIRYMGLLKADADTEAGVMPDETLLTAMGAFIEAGVKAGVILSGEGLQPSAKGVRVRYSGNKRTVLDGPFAETKELVAGYAIIQAASKAEAIEWTKRFVTVDAPGRHRQESECEILEIVER
ncbi:MAG TPA: YciI family protein [Candidatus Polarisedimenticolaceae bacterium]